MNKDCKGLKTTNNQTDAVGMEDVKAYGSSREHLWDELKRLDLLLRLHLLREHKDGQQLDIPDRFAGMALSAGEIFSLLGDSSSSCDENLLADELVILDKHIDTRLKASSREGVNLSLPHISKIFGLGSFEERCIIICLAPELGRKYEKIYAYFQNDINEKYPTVEFVLNLLIENDEKKVESRKAFQHQAPLMKFLMENGGSLLDSGIPLLARPLKLDNWAVNFLLDFKILDFRLRQVANLILPEESCENRILTDIGENAVRFINHYISSKKEMPHIFYFYGPDGAGKKTNTTAICRRLGVPVIMADIEKMLVSDVPFFEILRLLGRQVMIENMALGIMNFEILLTDDGRHSPKINMLMEMITSYAPITFLMGLSYWSPNILDSEYTFIAVEFPLPCESESKVFWQTFCQSLNLDHDIDLDDFKGKFRFTPGQIRTSIARSENLAIWSGSEEGSIGKAELYKACYSQSNSKLTSMAPKINVVYTWDMLVLPKDQMSQLREITNQVKYRSIVYGEWGFDKRLSLGKGLSILFSGPPGSGKTMAAEVIANELSMEIYKIDVSQIVSKYIGETEKNLSRIFAEAETSNSILFFDEADALFGKRSEVKDAHDRYANVEISYLLQKMEEYKGVVILATNLNQNIDEAFLRRLNFNVEFPFPEKEQRKLIWLAIFPSAAPLSQDIDYDFMAEKFVLAGGNIKNIALNAAFYAAQDSCPIGMKQIMLAARREYKKIGKTFLKSDFDPYYKLIEVI
ncbi:MAG: ATP-binding protein [Bacillota bacterium]